MPRARDGPGPRRGERISLNIEGDGNVTGNGHNVRSQLSPGNTNNNGVNGKNSKSRFTKSLGFTGIIHGYLKIRKKKNAFPIPAELRANHIKRTVQRLEFNI